MIYIFKKRKKNKTHWSILAVRVQARVSYHYSEGRLVKGEPGIILPFLDNSRVRETKELMKEQSSSCKNSS